MSVAFVPNFFSQRRGGSAKGAKFEGILLCPSLSILDSIAHEKRNIPLASSLRLGERKYRVMQRICR